MEEMDASLTTELMWRAAWVTALIDAPLLVLVARGVRPKLFAGLRWELAGAAFGVFAVIWGAFGSVLYWDAVYRAIFPSWWRWLLPVIYGTLDGLLALLFWRASVAAPRWQALWFVLLGGLLSLVGHGIGASRGLFGVPMLAQVSIVSALTFGVFEYIFYWCGIVGIAVAAGKVLRARNR